MGERALKSQSEVVRQVAQALNDDVVKGRTARLARLMGTGVDTVRSWSAAGESKARKRQMNPTARRLMFLLLALHQDGHDLDGLRTKARALERAMLGEND